MATLSVLFLFIFRLNGEMPLNLTATLDCIFRFLTIQDEGVQELRFLAISVMIECIPQFKMSELKRSEYMAKLKDIDDAGGLGELINSLEL